MQQISLEDYISAGYFVTQFVNGTSINEWMRAVLGAAEDLLPERIISSGFCQAPGAPMFDSSEEEYTQFGIPTAHIPELTKWANGQLNRQIGYPNVFFRLPTAREYVQRFVKYAEDIQLIGISLYKDELSKVAEGDLMRHVPDNVNGAGLAAYGDNGFVQSLSLHESPMPGEMLAYDVIGTRYNIEHSWHCNGLAVAALREFNFRPNQYGLIDDKANADKLAAYANEGLTEDCVWLSDLVTRYTLQS